MRHSTPFLTAALFCAAAVLLSIGQAVAAGRAAAASSVSANEVLTRLPNGLTVYIL